MAAYALARFTHPLGKAAFGLFLAGLTIPAQLAIVPLFFELRATGLLNSRPGLILVYTANGLPVRDLHPGGLLPLAAAVALRGRGRRRMRGILGVLEGAPAAGEAGLVTVAIFQFIGVWKEYFYAFMLVSGDTAGSARTLPLGLANLSIAAEYRTNTGCSSPGSSSSRFRS
jgi:ABC-type glycerol-3-phosphate transport system permease component